MFKQITTITEFGSPEAQAALRRGRYGVIETADGRVVAIRLRPWPKLLSWPELWPTRGRYHARGDADRCLLYYNQPRRHGNFIALKYVVSTAGTSYATFRAALTQLDRIAELKRTDALLCDAANTRLSDRLLARFGWEPHAPTRWRRNFIKRFYGVYPPNAAPGFAGGSRCEPPRPAAPIYPPAKPGAAGC